MRERLIELLKKAHDEQKYLTSDKSINAIADYLLDNGVIILTCKEGETVVEMGSILIIKGHSYRVTEYVITNNLNKGSDVSIYAKDVLEGLYGRNR